jgi:hypothetical protein
MMSFSMSNKYTRTFRESLVAGVGYAFGLTLGFTIISTIVVGILSQLNTLPVVGDFVASIVEATTNSLGRK